MSWMHDAQAHSHVVVSAKAVAKCVSNNCMDETNGMNHVTDNALDGYFWEQNCRLVSKLRARYHNISRLRGSCVNDVGLHQFCDKKKGPPTPSSNGE